jgi:hypothetical protein
MMNGSAMFAAQLSWDLGQIKVRQREMRFVRTQHGFADDRKKSKQDRRKQPSCFCDVGGTGSKTTLL